MGRLKVEQCRLFKLNIQYQESSGQAFSIRGIAKYPFFGRFFKAIGLASVLKIEKNGELKKYYINTKSFFRHAAKVEQLALDKLETKKLKKINNKLFDKVIVRPATPSAIHVHLGPFIVVSGQEGGQNEETKQAETSKDLISPEKSPVAPVLPNTVAPSASSDGPSAAPSRRERLLAYAEELLESDEELEDIEELPLSPSPEKQPLSTSHSGKIHLKGGMIFVGEYDREEGGRIVFKKGALQSQDGAKSWDGEWQNARLYSGTFTDIAVNGKEGLMKIEYNNGEAKHRMVRTKSRKFALSQWFEGFDGKVLERFNSNGNLVSIKSSLIGSHFDAFATKAEDPIPRDDFYEEEGFDLEGFFTDNDKWKFESYQKQKLAASPVVAPLSEDAARVKQGVVELAQDHVFDGFYLEGEKGEVELKIGTYRNCDYTSVYDGDWSQDEFTGFHYEAILDGGSYFKRSLFLHGALYKERIYRGDEKLVRTYAIKDSNLYKKGELNFVKVYSRSEKRLLEVTYYKANLESYRLSGQFNENVKLVGLGSETLYGSVLLKFRGIFENGVKGGEFRIIHPKHGLLAIGDYEDDRLAKMQLGPFDDCGEVIGDGLSLTRGEAVQFLYNHENKPAENEAEERYLDVLWMILLHQERVAGGAKTV